MGVLALLHTRTAHDLTGDCLVAACLGIGPSQSRPPCVGSAETCLSSCAHKHCTALLCCAEVLPLRYASVAIVRPRCEAPSWCGYHVRPLSP